ncbi:MAG TPA: hypothetical protein VNO32_05985 [Candidatus Acidoferrum sp.]|jgi:hypothetical protein|nr:hypothetical protein [Candidatus Acidoferrum sp.]
MTLRLVSEKTATEREVLIRLRAATNDLITVEEECGGVPQSSIGDRDASAGHPQT